MNALITVTPRGIRYYLDGLRVAPDTFRSTVASAARHDTFHTRCHGDTIRHYSALRLTNS